MFPAIFRAALLAASCGIAAAAAAQAVAPPPLPPGHAMVRPELGMSEPERKRYVRAHHHKFHHKKDFTRDDSIHGHESESVVRTVAPASPGQPGGAAQPAAAQGAAGTGPARENTGRGASSWFHGQPDSKK